MQIQQFVSRTGSSDDTQLPEAHTCFFALDLPRYSNKDLLKEKLLYAITICREIDADYLPNERDQRDQSSCNIM